MGNSTYLDIRNADVFQGLHKVFSNLNLQLYTGEHTVILGPNGAGKSTLLKLLTRDIYPVAKPDAWVKIYGSERVLIWELRRQIGLVSHDLQNHYDGHIKGLDVVISGFFGSIGVHGHQTPSAAQRASAQALMENLGIGDLQDNYYQRLSTGQQRRLLLARALVHQPKVLILDEPTNGMDLKAAHQFLATLRQLAQTGTSILLVTHHIGEIIPEISRCIMLNQGRIAMDGAKQDCLQAKTLCELFSTELTVRCENGFYQVFPANS